MSLVLVSCAVTAVVILTRVCLHCASAGPEILRLPTYRLNKLVEIVGMSTNHADRFKEALRVQRRQLHVQQLMPSADAGDSCVIL